MVATNHFVLQTQEFLEIGKSRLVRLGLRKVKAFRGVSPNASKKWIVLHVDRLISGHNPKVARSEHKQVFRLRLLETYLESIFESV